MIIGRRGSIAAVVRSLFGGLRSGGGRRVQWGIVDQLLSSVTNFTITAVVAHQSTPAEFGSFSVAMVVYVCVLWAARSLLGEPYAVRMTAASEPEQRAAARQVVGAALVVGVISAAVIAAVGVAVRPWGGALVAMAVFMPALLVQDTYRYVLIARGRARDAAANDGLWLGVQSLLAIGLLLAGDPSAVGLTVAFGTGAAVAGALGIRQSRTSPSPPSWLTWLRAQRDLGIPFLTELLFVSAAPQLSMLGVAALGGVVAVGEVRAAIFLCSPPTVLFSGLVLVAVPEAVRVRRRSLSGLRTLVIALAVAMTLITALWVALLELVPSHVGTALLGANWDRGRRLLLPVGVFTAAAGSTYAALVGLRALEATRASLRTRLWAGPAILASCAIGAHAGGSGGASVALAGSAVFSLVLSWGALRRALAAAAPSLPAGTGRVAGLDRSVAALTDLPDEVAGRLGPHLGSPPPD